MLAWSCAGEHFLLRWRWCCGPRKGSMQRGRTAVAAGSVLAAAAIGVGVYAATNDSEPSKPSSKSAAPRDALRQTAAFPNAHDQPPAGWNGPVFQLSQAYPATKPA